MRTRDLTFRSAAILLLLTVGAFLVMGYHPGAEDDFVYLPAIKRDLNPALFPHDAEFFRLQLQATVFDKVVAASVRLTHIPLEWALPAWQVGAIFLVLLGCWKVARRCFAEDHARWCGVVFVAALLTMPVAGTSLFLVDQHLHPRTLATAFVLLAITAMLDRRYGRAGAWIAAALAFHPIMGAFGGSYCVFLGWPFGVPRKTQRSSAALKASGSATLGTTVNGLLLALLPVGAFMPLGWIFEPPTAAWREAAGTRDYYFLGRQQWYEWVGTLAPFAILWAFSKIKESGPPAAGPSGHRVVVSRSRDLAGSSSEIVMHRLCRRLIWYGVFQFAVTLAIMLPPPLERWRTLQPLRYLHLLYLLMLLIGGGLLGGYVLKNKAWRWAVLFLPITGGMLYAQRQEFPASAHIEVGRAVSNNVWENAFEWIRTNTPQGAYFALGPRYYDLKGEDWHSFRAIAERSQLADTLKDPSVSTQVPRLATRWQRESHAQDGWDNFGLQDFERLKRDFGVDWVVLKSGVNGLVCPYTSSGQNGVQVAVCRIP